MPKNSNHEQLVQTRQLITAHFNVNEFRDFCFRLGVNYDHLEGENLPARVRELVLQMEREGRLDDLIYFCIHLRPKVAWPAEAVPNDLLSATSTPMYRNPRLIFLSHASQDAAFAHQLAQDIRIHGWEVWIAPDSIRPGEKWVSAINRGLAESGVFLLVLTPHAVASKWVQSETNVAIGLEHQDAIRLIPLEIQPIASPPLLWQAYQWISFRESYQEGLQNL